MSKIASEENFNSVESNSIFDYDLFVHTPLAENQATITKMTQDDSEPE